MGKNQTYDICVQHLYDDADKLTFLAPQIRDRLLRIRSAYTLMVEHPSKPDREIIQHIMSTSGIERSAAYEDIRIIKDLLGSINKQSKDWHRYKFNTQIQKAYDMAELKNEPESMVKAMNVYGKYNQLDKEDAERIPWDEIVPQTFEPTEDPSVIGIKPIPNFKEKQAAMKKKYEGEIEDVTYEEIDLKNIEKYADH
jgi:hypothetical protein